MSAGRTGRARGLQLPSVIAGLVVGGLLVGAFAPLVGNRLKVESGGGRTPGIFGPAATDGTPTTTSSVVGAPSATSEPTAGGGTSGPSGKTAATVARTASDVGVTPDAISVGMMLLKCDGCGAFGLDFPKTGPQVVNAFVADINARGGIDGRRLDVHIQSFDQLEDALQGGATQRKACIDLTEQQPIFAAMAIGVTQLECLYKEHGLPVVATSIGNGTDPGTFNDSGGKLWTITPSPRRMLVNWADQLVASGTLSKDKPFGIVTIGAQQFDRPITDVLVPRLRELGYNPAQVTVLPNDAAASTTARATEGAAMRAKGINTVLLAMDFLNSSLWIQEAERNRWTPQYLVSDYATPADDSTAATQPASFRGALAVSALPPEGNAPSPADQHCTAVWEKAAGRKVAGQEEEGLVGTICNLMVVLERGLKAAGPNPTRTSLVQGLGTIGQVPVAGAIGGVGTLGGPYAFGPVKWTAVDEYLVKRWDGHRYVAVSGPQRMTA